MASSASSRTFQCLSCRLNIQFPIAARRSFHVARTSKAREGVSASSSKRSSRQPPTAQTDLDQPHLRAYTAREKKLLALKYTPEQMRIIEAGEEAIPAEKLATAKMRTDPMRIRYLDDFATLRPVLDRPLQESDGVEELTAGANSSRRREGEGAGEGEQSEKSDDLEPQLLRLSQQTGLGKMQIGKLRVKTLVTRRVANQTRMGKILSVSFLTVAGNEDGMVGLGEGKAIEDEDARRQAMMNAVRNMRPIPRYEERTIYGDVEAKVGAAVVQLSARPPGFGNRAQHLIFELARAAGISDLAARTPRGRNKMNVVKAAFEALVSQRLPEDVARGRGRKMVDVRRVYYGGTVL